jgi:glycerol dehydrogenase
MKKVMISPSKYVQGENELSNLGEYVQAFGTKALLIASKDDQGRVQSLLDAAQKKVDFTLEAGGFNLECSWAEVKRLKAVADAKGSDVIIGLGGGKSLDTAKAVAHLTNKPVIIVPTIASTDAPCSALAVIYTESGEFEEYFFFRNNPNLVLVDTAVIAKAPVRFLVAGMGDALSTWIEARACAKSFAKNASHGNSTMAANAIAKLCYDTLFEDSLKAKAACEAGVVTQALENIVEANILLSGLGFESSGLAACHSIHNGLTVLEETHHFFHGEKVAFGAIVQLVLENAPHDELVRTIKYCQSVGLPTCLADLGVKEVTADKVMKVAIGSTAEGETIHNMPFPVTADMVCAAIFAADKLGAHA